MTTTETLQPTTALRNLYLTRTAVQFLWAVATMVAAAKNPLLAAALLVLYPLWDVACTLYDLKTSATTGSATVRYINLAMGILTTIGIALTVYTQPRYAVAIFGLWALAAGALQLALGISRRKQTGGQWPMILSGAQSVLAGIAFTIGGFTDKRHIHDIGGYAIFGAVYFLIGGILLSRRK